MNPNPNVRPWLLSGLYAPPTAYRRHLLWDELSMISDHHQNIPWLATDDFLEEVDKLFQFEKFLRQSLRGGSSKLFQFKKFRRSSDQSF
ncbi:hypothetical protein FRX31_008485 [Thalictrum thalictroides]|uniref:Uncharacterized protein n=1 Tax=Thalictrum thalictroides TaxID=46969 RepID=A0A7J6WWW5_THATH|nr:hypothetical protein FRX31_008485 [Thalictrum thalictroides]